MQEIVIGIIALCMGPIIFIFRKRIVLSVVDHVNKHYPFKYGPKQVTMYSHVGAFVALSFVIFGILGLLSGLGVI